MRGNSGRNSDFLLWIMASLNDNRYISVVACFGAFLANDIYGFISWRKMEKRQAENIDRVG